MNGKMDLAKFLSIVPRGDLWVFGYGSLMWSPDFPHAERKAGRVHGYHRSLCILSSRYRGTPDKPGLVMGLCPGGSCRGMAFRSPASKAKEVLDTLWKREMLNKVYTPKFVPVYLADAQQGTQRVQALAFVADTTHRQFVDELDVDGRARLVTTSAIRWITCGNWACTTRTSRASSKRRWTFPPARRTNERLSTTCTALAREAAPPAARQRGA